MESCSTRAPLRLSFALLALAHCGPSSPAADAATDTPAAIDVRSTPDAARASLAGAPCTDDAMCGGAPLRCELTLSSPGFCTASCRNHPVVSREQAQCGGAGSACLNYEDGVTPAFGRCARACTGRGRAAPSGCGEGQICTTNFIIASTGIDRAACAPFCRTDAHCPMGKRCNPRTGICGTGLNMELLPDGSLCQPPDPTGGTRPGPCRGFCAPIGLATNRTGVCISMVNAELNEACPDDPTMITPFAAPEDNMMICGPRDCSETNCCGPGLECSVFPEEATPRCVTAEGNAFPVIECLARPDAGAEAGTRDASADGSD
jgi:hypothetical protein